VYLTRYLREYVSNMYCEHALDNIACPFIAHFIEFHSRHFTL